MLRAGTGMSARATIRASGRCARGRGVRVLRRAREGCQPGARQRASSAGETFYTLHAGLRRGECGGNVLHLQPGCINIDDNHGGRPTDIDRRAIVTALLDNHRTGCQWRMRPNDVPPMRSVRYDFDKRNRDGTFININDTPRKLAQQAPDRDPEPSISVLDSQSVKTTEAGRERGYDGEKKVNGRKRQCWVDTNGFLVRVLVRPADISDTTGAEWLLAAHHHAFPRMHEIRVDEG